MITGSIFRITELSQQKNKLKEKTVEWEPLMNNNQFLFIFSILLLESHERTNKHLTVTIPQRFAHRISSFVEFLGDQTFLITDMYEKFGYQNGNFGKILTVILKFWEDTHRDVEKIRLV